MTPTAKQEKAILDLAKHYSVKTRPPRWHVRRDYLWNEIAKPIQDDYQVKIERERDGYSSALELVISNHYREIAVFSKSKATYLRHIKRLQDQCRVLGEVVADERLAKKAIHEFNEDQKRYKRMGMRMVWCPTYWKSFIRLALQKMHMK